MKSSLFITTVLACSIATPAFADYPYVKLNYGRTFESATVTDRTDTVEAIADIDLAGGNLFGFAIGTDFELNESPWAEFSWEGEFAYRGANISSVQLTGDVPGGFIDGAALDDVETFSLLGNVWWRPAVFGKIRPYIGGGVGAAYLPAGGLSADNIYALAYQFGLGVDYEFDNGLRAGIGYRHFEISATDRDDDDPLFVFETDSELSEDALYASFTAPFSFFSGDTPRRSTAKSPEAAREQQAKSVEKTRKQAEKAKLKADKRAQKAAKKLEKKQAKAAKKQAKRDAKLARVSPTTDTALAQPESKAFDAIPTATLKPPSPKTDEVVKASLETESLKTKYVAQLGAFSSESMARDMWRVKAQRQPNVFSGSAARIKRIKRQSDDKTLYLLQVGPFEKSRAKAICALAAGDCLVSRG